MTRLIWNDFGQRYFETGVSHGVFFNADGIGVPWNGLTAINETPSGGEAKPYYYDGVKYLNIAGREELAGTIEAYTYPDEFADYDGSEQMFTGFSVDLQRRRSFTLCYRTRVGNDVAGTDYGYKIHIIYNMLASPSQKTYSSLNGSVDPMMFSWGFTTTPVHASNTYKRISHVAIDSTKVSPGLMRVVEQHLYGSQSRSSSLMDLDKLIYWFESGGEPLEIDTDFDSGISDLHSSIGDRPRDLVTTDTPGLHFRTYDSRLVEVDPNTLPTNL